MHRHTHDIWSVSALCLPLDAPPQRGALLAGPGIVLTSVSKVHFNRGTAGSQEYRELTGGKAPWDRSLGDTAWQWLSNGLEEALAAFIRRAEGPVWPSLVPGSGRASPTPGLSGPPALVCPKRLCLGHRVCRRSAPIKRDELFAVLPSGAQWMVAGSCLGVFYDKAPAALRCRFWFRALQAHSKGHVRIWDCKVMGRDLLLLMLLLLLLLLLLVVLLLLLLLLVLVLLLLLLLLLLVLVLLLLLLLLLFTFGKVRLTA